MIGGPLAGQQYPLTVDTELYWVVDDRLVANTADIGAKDVMAAHGLYEVQALRRKGGSTEWILFWRRLRREG